MLERVSALAAAHPYKSDVLKIAEHRGFSLTQASGLSKDFQKKLSPVVGALPKKIGVAVEHEGRTLLRTGPEQLWIIGPEADDVAKKLHGLCAVVPLSHSRTRILIEGGPARDVLAKGMAIDFHPKVFTPGMFAMTGLHHMPVLVHCVDENRFHLYAMRTFAMTVWEWLTDAALVFSGTPATP
ncbi:sarcosine oxidase subunit gamma [Aestuariivirga sp.]|uniref:sarcosine oxidase subunit gamma n=1 Tax=Aestuariivirga sp. TaxID=2650926 RepID=UPI0039E70960